MDMSPNQFTARMTGGCRHEAVKSWIRRSGEVLDEIDGVQPATAVVPSIENYEHMIGRELIEGRITVEEAYQAVGNFATWHATQNPEIELI